VQHAPQATTQNSFAGVDTSINSQEVRSLIALTKEFGSPTVLHLEFNDNAAKKPSTMLELKALAREISPHPIVLIHAAQSNEDDVRSLIDAHENIFFMLSRSDSISANNVAKRMKTNNKAQEGWVSMFNGNDWKPEWRALLIAHPHRFIIAIDSVFWKNWKNHYHNKVIFWRSALGELPIEAAQKIGCENARVLWKVDIDCSPTQ
jgi:predicted TIM-barrel fold metal-dependent hydrolase